MDLNNAYQLISNKIFLWIKEVIRLLPNLALSALILVIGFLIAKFARKVAYNLIRRISHLPTLNNLFASFVYILVVGITLFTVLSVLHLDKAVTSILAGAGIVGLALAFAFQDIAANFVSGIFISFRRPINIGDVVKVHDYMGKVQEINLRDTMIQTFQGQSVIIPNKDVFQNPIENFSLLGKRRMDLTVGVSYGDNLQKAKQVALAAVQKVSNRTKDDEVTLFFDEFADSSINFSIRIWINSPEQPAYLQAKSEAIMLIKEAFDENNIMIPYPIRTLDFGIKGGEKLSEMALRMQKDL